MANGGDGDLDETSLNDLVDLGGPPLLERLIKIFLDQSPARIVQAKEAAATGDFDGVLRAVHTLGSASGTLGARKFQELCTAMEVSCRARETDTVHRLIPQLEPGYTRVCAALASVSARYEAKSPNSV